VHLRVFVEGVALIMQWALLASTFAAGASASCASAFCTSSLRMTVTNEEHADGVVFCRGDFSELYLDAGLSQSVVGSSIDCSPGQPAASKWGEGVNNQKTLAIGLTKGSSNDLYLAASGSWIAGTCWFQDSTSNAKQSLAKGPQYQSQIEWTILKDGEGPVSYDLTSVEGVSGGISMSYVDSSGSISNSTAVPPKPATLKVVEAPGFGFKTILADKHVVTGSCACNAFSPTDDACNTDACYAGCPAALVNVPCGQHRCREWYAKKYADADSYCGWLYASGAQTYCWAMDEWTCTDTSCGYGGPDEPNEACTSPMPSDAAANSYSCGHVAEGQSLPDGQGGSYWGTSGPGCQDKKVNGVPTNPQPRRNGGQVEMKFINLAWLHEDTPLV